MNTYNTGLGEHKYHYQMSTSNLVAEVDLMPKEDRELVKSCGQLNFTATSVSNLLTIQDRLGMHINWDVDQIRHLTKKDHVIKSQLDKTASSAENLVATFATREDVNYLYVTFNVTDGLMLLTEKCGHR